MILFLLLHDRVALSRTHVRSVSSCGSSPGNSRAVVSHVTRQRSRYTVCITSDHEHHTTGSTVGSRLSLENSALVGVMCGSSLTVGFRSRLEVSSTLLSRDRVVSEAS